VDSIEGRRIDRLTVTFVQSGGRESDRDDEDD
jgi:hypothetical protein